MSHYFIRFSACQEYLQDDLQRGYSFRAYQFDVSPEALCDEYGYDVDDENLNIQEHSDGTYGFALDGLCGYGPFETVEKAEEEARHGSYGCYTVCGIYAGRSAGLDPDSNAELFAPTALVKSFDTQEAVAA